MKSHSLTFDRLVVGRDGVPLTLPLSLKVEAGQMLAIHGANGSGKSTLLKIIAGLLQPCEGSFYFDGDPSAPRYPVLYLGHKRGITPGMSVYDNVSFWARVSGQPELTAAAMRYFDLDDIPEVAVDTLSAGWQQRVALTRLITTPSPLWLLDEPTANLDSQGIALLQSIMQSRLEQGGIILVATHLRLQGPNIRAIDLSDLGENIKGEAA